MPEVEPTHADLEVALEAYHATVLDGTERDIRSAEKHLRGIQAKLGEIATLAAEAATQAEEEAEPSDAPPDAIAS